MARRHTHLLLATCLVSISTTVLAGAVPPHIHAHAHEGVEDHAIARGLPKRWYHEDESHPVHKLFGRQDNELKNDGETYAEIGSAEWTALFPSGTPDASAMPQAWRDALKAAEDAGTIPDIPRTTRISSDDQPVYPAGIDARSPEVCNSGRGCRHPDDIFNGLDGHFAVNFDDGPAPEGSARLYDYLSTRTPHIPTTHFLIGHNVLLLPNLTDRLINELHADLAVHTYTHRQLTLLSNEDIMAELAWTMEIIRVSSGGRIPRFWRPPTGDADNRVRAIAKEVLGMDIVMWNGDTDDYAIATGHNTQARVVARFKDWAEGPKSPGLIILEHETSNTTAQLFIDAVPVLEGAGWTITSVAQITEGKIDPYGAYYNVDEEGNVGKGAVADPGNVVFPEPEKDSDEDEGKGGDVLVEDQNEEGSAVGVVLSSRFLALAVVVLGALLGL